MTQRVLRIGTRDSELAVWQATLVQNLLKEAGVASELVYIKSEGDVDTITPLYALGVQGVFTRALDAALLNNRIDIAVHSMKDVPTQLAQGIRQTAVLKRASYKDILVAHPDLPEGKAILALASLSEEHNTIQLSGSVPGPIPPSGGGKATIATGSVRRIAQWLHRYPDHHMENLRGNVNTRLRKLKESNWNGAIFAAAGLERINLRPQNSIELDWMLPAPAQGAIIIVCRSEDQQAFDACHILNDANTELCTRIERDFLQTLMGGCSTPISALAEMQYAQIVFKGNICSTDGSEKIAVEKVVNISDANDLGIIAANEIINKGGAAIVANIRQKGLTTNA